MRVRPLRHLCTALLLYPIVSQNASLFDWILNSFFVVFSFARMNNTVFIPMPEKVVVIIFFYLEIKLYIILITSPFIIIISDIVLVNKRKEKN